jgi:predicted methyltransferase MtxX (methanogen marker protein 4)
METQTGATQMAYFSQITDARRFTVEGRNEVFASYDCRRAGFLLAPVGADETGAAVFVGKPEHFFTDEVEEVR